MVGVALPRGCKHLQLNTMMAVGISGRSAFSVYQQMLQKGEKSNGVKKVIT